MLAVEYVILNILVDKSYCFFEGCPICFLVHSNYLERYFFLKPLLFLSWILIFIGEWSRHNISWPSILISSIWFNKLGVLKFIYKRLRILNKIFFIFNFFYHKLKKQLNSFIKIKQKLINFMKNTFTVGIFNFAAFFGNTGFLAFRYRWFFEIYSASRFIRFVLFVAILWSMSSVMSLFNLEIELI